MRLWIGLSLPCLSLDVYRPTWLADALGAHAVLDGQRVCAMTPAAHEAGIQIGMRRAAAAAIAPAAIMTDRNSAREREALAALGLTLLRFTPQVAHVRDAVLVLDVTASVRLFAGVRTLCRQILADVAVLGLTAHLGLAPTAAGAWLLATQAEADSPAPRRRVVKMPTLSRCLDQLPLDLLPETEVAATWLAGIGCRTLGDLRRLPRAGLKRRCGIALPEALDRAYGAAPEMFIWLVAPPVFSAKLELPDRVDDAAALLFAGRRLLLQMTGWLAAHHQAVARYVLYFKHERGRRAIAPTALGIHLAEAAWEPEHLARLLKERLARIELVAPVIAIRLRADDVRDRAPLSDKLFPDPAGSSSDAAQLIELLSARLGAQNVRQFALMPDHRPEVANAWVPAASAKATKLPVTVLPQRPAWLLETPLPLITRHHRPFYGAPLRLMGKPERIEAGWFDDRLITRDYFVAEAEDGSRYWVYQQRMGSTGDQDVRWFLHGLFA